MHSISPVAVLSTTHCLESLHSRTQSVLAPQLAGDMLRGRDGWHFRAARLTRWCLRLRSKVSWERAGVRHNHVRDNQTAPNPLG
jgi:hypothetical protein